MGLLCHLSDEHLQGLLAMLLDGTYNHPLQLGDPQFQLLGAERGLLLKKPPNLGKDAWEDLLVVRPLPLFPVRDDGAHPGSGCWSGQGRSGGIAYAQTSSVGPQLITLGFLL